MHQLDHGLARSEALQNLFAQGLLPHVSNKLLNDGQRYIGLEQCNPHFPQSFANAVFGQPALAAQLLYRTRQTFCQILKHESLPAIGVGYYSRGKPPKD